MKHLLLSLFFFALAVGIACGESMREKAMARPAYNYQYIVARRTNVRAVFAIGAAADFGTMLAGRSQGLREVNPIIGNSKAAPYILGAVIALQYLAAERLRASDGNDIRANRWERIFAAIHGGAALWNGFQLAKAK